MSKWRILLVILLVVSCILYLISIFIPTFALIGSLSYLLIIGVTFGIASFRAVQRLKDVTKPINIRIIEIALFVIVAFCFLILITNRYIPQSPIFDYIQVLAMFAGIILSLVLWSSYFKKTSLREAIIQPMVLIPILLLSAIILATAVFMLL